MTVYDEVYRLGLEKHAGLFSWGAKALGKAVGTAEKGGPGIMSHLGSLVGFSSKPGTIGSKIYKPLNFLGGFGRGAAAKARRMDVGLQAGGFGTFTGAMNAMNADEGDRLSAFGKGFISGGLGGAAWAHGSSAFKGLAGRLAKGKSSTFWKEIATRAKPGKLVNGKLVENVLSPHSPGTFNKGWLSRLGAKGVMGVGGLAAGMGANVLSDTVGAKFLPGVYGESIGKHMNVYKNTPRGAIKQEWHNQFGLTPRRNAGSIYAARQGYPTVAGPVAPWHQAFPR